MTLETAYTTIAELDELEHILKSCQNDFPSMCVRQDELSQRNQDLARVGEAMKLMEGGCSEVQIKLDGLKVENCQIDKKDRGIDMVSP